MAPKYESGPHSAIDRNLYCLNQLIEGSHLLPKATNEFCSKLLPQFFKLHPVNDKKHSLKVASHTLHWNIKKKKISQ